MTETVEIGGTCDLICNLKAAVTALECQHNMNMLKKQTRKKACKKPPPPPMFVMIPLEQQMNGDRDSLFEDGIKRRRRNNDFDSECSDSIASSIESTKGHHQSDNCNDSGKGPGVRAGVLHTRCFCIHRDGLQDHCPLTECQNDPDCMKRPPHCAPAKYFRSRFPDNYP